MNNSWQNKYIDLANRIVYAIKVQSYRKAGIMFSDMLADLEKEEFFIRAVNDPEDSMGTILSAMLSALDSRDMILMADIMEESFIQWFRDNMDYPESIETGKYVVEATAVGSLTLLYKPTGVYMHSNNNPMEQARELIRHCFDREKISYAVYGLGLGYHVKALMEYTQGAAKIKVFERDSELIEIVKKLGILDEYGKSVEIIHDKNSQEFTKCIADSDYGIVMHYPSIMRIEDDREATAIKRFYAVWNGMNEAGIDIAVNINKNLQNCKNNVDEIETDIRDKKVIVVAAGPSLDDNLETLKTKQQDGETIIAVAAIYGKLQACGIEPDYVVAMDASKLTYKQMANVKAGNAGLIVGGSAYWEFADRYEGRKYIALQKENSKTELLARETGADTYKTGGTVTSLAIDIAVRLGAKEIGLVGVDMAYKDGYTHASSTAARQKVSTDGLIKIKGVNGEDVYTEERLYSYLKWIEQEIKENPQVRFVNYSECGAYIEGAVKATK